MLLCCVLKGSCGSKTGDLGFREVEEGGGGGEGGRVGDGSDRC